MVSSVNALLAGVARLVRLILPMDALEAHVKMEGSALTHLPVLVSPALVHKGGTETRARRT